MREVIKSKCLSLSVVTLFFGVFGSNYESLAQTYFTAIVSQPVQPPNNLTRVDFAIVGVGQNEGVSVDIYEITMTMGGPVYTAIDSTALVPVFYSPYAGYTVYTGQFGFHPTLFVGRNYQARFTLQATNQVIVAQNFIP